ncbi:hypothetical protein [Tahibacter sp.]|uniref:hypothetical protein n=1 Tax=Tahibacter sp. TaxID=2056211 RepID=UPI0028C445DB|nr:hypothetical protein [Tahibacter sp.]
MRRRLFAALLLLLPLGALAQAPGPDPAANGFDFLLGAWRLDVHVKVSGLAALIHGAPKLSGTLTVRRKPDGMEDELVVVDASGNPRSTSRSRRVYDATGARWNITSTDAYDARQGSAQGRQEAGEMHVDGSYTRGSDTTLTRSRYFAIKAESFRFTQDRSYDNGATWDEGVFAYDATRTAAVAP